MASQLRYFGEKGRMKCRQDRIYIWPISPVFLRALGAGDIDPIVGNTRWRSLLTEFFRFFGMRASWMQIIGGPCSKILCISLLPLWYPWGPTFHDTAFSTEFVETEPVILRLTSQLSLCFSSEKYTRHTVVSSWSL